MKYPLHIYEVIHILAFHDKICAWYLCCHNVLYTDVADAAAAAADDDKKW